MPPPPRGRTRTLPDPPAPRPPPVQVVAELGSRGLDVFGTRYAEIQFQDVVCRGRGRLDIRHGFDDPVFHDMAKKGAWFPVVEAVLGSNVKLNYAGLLLNMVGSDDQDWCMDSEHLFPGTNGPHLAAHALAVFVPLVDVVQELGTPEFFAGSHVEEVSTALRQGATVDPPVAWTLPAGSAIVFDYRIIHRDTANRSGPAGSGALRHRPMLYYVFSKRWFTDEENWDFDGGCLFPPTR